MWQPLHRVSESSRDKGLSVNIWNWSQQCELWPQGLPGVSSDVSLGLGILPGLGLFFFFCSQLDMKPSVLVSDRLGDSSSMFAAMDPG